jgi:DNA (cytosine-5)-methyltransferase 1
MFGNPTATASVASPSPWRTDLHDLTHIDLFSGIGGFALAAQWAGFRTVAFCEIEPFCQEVLKARFGAIADAERKGLEGSDSAGGIRAGRWDSKQPHGRVLIPDIRGFDGTRFRGATLLTGGFPCQPFSVAGKRKGKEDDRHLWPEMLRVISEARPAWVVGENVAGIVNMELEQVCLDLEGEGYEVQPVIIPACAVNAPHRRDRVWIVANDKCRGRGTGSDAPDAEGEGLEGRNPKGAGRTNGWDTERLVCGQRSNQAESWDIPWIEVATRLCGVDDGLPRRVDRLKALGNSIVPQVAYQIIKEIVEIEGTRPT